LASNCREKNFASGDSDAAEESIAHAQALRGRFSCARRQLLHRAASGSSGRRTLQMRSCKPEPTLQRNIVQNARKMAAIVRRCLFDPRLGRAMHEGLDVRDELVHCVVARVGFEQVVANPASAA